MHGMEPRWHRSQTLHLSPSTMEGLCVIIYNHSAVYVAGYSASGERHNELLQLLLPEKLLPPEKQVVTYIIDSMLVVI